MNDINKISIIVPVYNVEQYLTKCLDSLIFQTYKNIEIICINDESPDNSYLILEEYEKKDSRVKIITQKNTGLSGARNRGIDASTGDFIMFVDSDDWLDINTCEVAINIMVQKKIDVVLWSYIREFPNKSIPKKIFNEDFIYFSSIDVKQKLHRRFCGLINEELRHPENADAIVPVWGKLYRKHLIQINNVRFVDLNHIGTSEDALFNFHVFNFVSKAVFLNKYLYHYRKDNISSLTTLYKPNLFKQWQNLFDLMEKNIENFNLENYYKKSLDNRIALSIIGLGLNELSQKNSVSLKMSALKKIIFDDKYRSVYKNLKLTYFPIHWKIFFISAKYRFTPILYLLLMLIKRKISY